MISFLIWIFIIALALGIYSVILWKKSQQRSRFQARLTILFFLFVLIPIVPLTLFVSLLLTQSAEVLFLPGVEGALSESLEVMRLQLEQRGQRFLSCHENIKTLDLKQLQDAEMVLVREYVFNKESVQVNWQLAVEDSYTNIPVTLSSTDWVSAINGERTSVSFDFEKGKLFEAYRVVSNSILVSVCYPVDGRITRARSDIYWALRNYTSLSLLRDTFVQEGLIWGIAVLFILLLVLLAVYVARFISRGISEPIQKIAEAMKQVGTGNLTSRVEVEAKDELGFLVSSFNRMAEELQISRENLQRAERAAAWRDAARRVSHEIKNPLTPIQISMYRLRSSMPEELQTNVDFDQAFRTIMEEINALRRLADEFSQFARMPQISSSNEDVNEIIRSSARLFEAESRKVTFKLNLDPNLKPVQLDRELFKRAIHNLIKNAVEASHKGDSIDLRTSAVKTDDRKIRIDIIDYGQGMTQEVRAHASDPYFTTKKEGTGLGLSIVHRIISDHGGSIEIESEERKGTRISIFI
jgi:nitrogen fixation/metabolism regulation signal transduction histidine kinase